jgi:hypothetical protein
MLLKLEIIKGVKINNKDIKTILFINNIIMILRG